MKQITGGITAAKGFQAAGIEAGIKYQNRKDMAIIYSEKPCVAAGTFTSNVVKAAPVKWDKKLVEESPYVQAVIVNTGIANAGTGAEGMKLCEETAKEASKVLGIPENAVLVGSTGVIGAQLPIDRIKAGISRLAEAKNDSLESGTDASKAIMTTDTVNKELAVQVEIGGVTVTLGAMSKGSGMIHPNMCTMLGYVATDAVIEKEVLQKMLREDVVDTYNMISVDGDTSTNDTLLVLANGMAGDVVEDENEQSEDVRVKKEKELQDIQNLQMLSDFLNIDFDLNEFAEANEESKETEKQNDENAKHENEKIKEQRSENKANEAIEEYSEMSLSYSKHKD